MAVPFDLERLRVTGSPAQIMEGIRAQFASSRREPSPMGHKAHQALSGSIARERHDPWGHRAKLTVVLGCRRWTPATGGWDRG